MPALRSEASVDTAAPDHHLVQLCRQFAHQGPATYSPLEGRAEFASGHCSMRAKGRYLCLVVEAEDETSLARIQHIVSSYLEQSMWRESPTITWVRKSDKT